MKKQAISAECSRNKENKKKRSKTAVMRAKDEVIQGKINCCKLGMRKIMKQGHDENEGI